MPVRIEQVIAAWGLAAELNHASPGGVSADEIAAAERALGRTLPHDVRQLYAAYDGGGFIHSDIVVLPLLPRKPDDLALTTASALIRSWGWPIPPELVVFGGNGGDESYGLWLPEWSAQNALVIEIAEAFDK